MRQLPNTWMAERSEPYTRGAVHKAGALKAYHSKAMLYALGPLNFEHESKKLSRWPVTRLAILALTQFWCSCAYSAPISLA